MKHKRTSYCGQVSEADIGKEVVLCGWVDRTRDHGGVLFIDLRDREGTVQVVFDPSEHAFADASTLRQEHVIAIHGKVRTRPSGMENKNIPTGAVEVLADDLEIFSKSEPLPFALHEDSPSAGEVEETLRLTYRYLELRRPKLQRNLRIRHEFIKSARDYYGSHGFWEIETPILYKSTPEGARDYLVPSRMHKGAFYALPQSPQTLKQLCMIAGFDRYVQIARCFRDEDLRADRQPEFTQIDVEMSFINEDDIITLHEGLMKKVYLDVLKVDIATPFPRLRYTDAMEKYGSDKPDLRNKLVLVNLTSEAKKSSFQVYHDAVAKGHIVKGLCIEEKEPIPRSELDNLMSKIKPSGAKGISWVRIRGATDWQSPQAKFFDDALKAEITAKLSYQQNAMLFVVCGEPSVVNHALDLLRTHYGERLGYVDKSASCFLWVTEFPLLEFSETEKRFFAAHHPFTSPGDEDLPLFMSQNDPQALMRVRARAYDLVLNGCEIGGGSIRIHNSLVQSRMFEILGLSADEAKQKFGFFINALKYGTPPHGGIALGVDRIAMLLTGTHAIRDVIAFPKTQKASCLMSEAPSKVSEAQLKELGIELSIEPISENDEQAGL